MPSAPVMPRAATSSRRPALTITEMRVPSLVTGGRSLAAAYSARRFCAVGELGLERFLDRRRRPGESDRLAAVEQDKVALAITCWRTSRTRPIIGTPIARATMVTWAVSEPSSRITPFSLRRSYSSSSAGPRLRAIRIASCGRPACAAVPSWPETMRSSRFDRSSRSCIRSCSSGSSIWRMRVCVRCWTRSIAASAVRPLSIASLIRRDQPSS